MATHYLVNGEYLTAIADAIRSKTSSTEDIEITEMPAQIGGITGGVALPTLTSPASEDEIFLNKQTIDEDGNVLTGTFTIDTELNENEELITQIQEALVRKASVSLPTLENPATAENLEEGYELIDGDGNIVVGTHVCSGGSGGGEYGTMLIQHNLPAELDEMGGLWVNGVPCLSNTVTEVPLDMNSYISFYFYGININSGEFISIEDITYSYEYEGDDGWITEVMSPNWSNPVSEPFAFGMCQGIQDNLYTFNITLSE